MVIASIVTMPTSGTLMMGMTRFVPSQPVLSTVNVPPPKSSTRSLPARARSATSAMALFRPLIERLSTSRMTGTIRPSSTATATPMLIRRLASSPLSVQWALKVGLRLSASADGLDDERHVAERRSLARLVVALVASRGTATRRVDVDLHLDVGVRHGQGAGHLGGDALAHLGHRQEDFVGAGRELDRGAGREAVARGRRGRRGRAARRGQGAAPFSPAGDGRGRRCRSGWPRPPGGRRRG